MFDTFIKTYMYSSPSFQIWWFIRGMQVTKKKIKLQLNISISYAKKMLAYGVMTTNVLFLKKIHSKHR